MTAYTSSQREAELFGDRLRIIGMMSGTSVDSIDAALCEIYPKRGDRLGASLLGFHQSPMAKRLRERIFRLFEDDAGALSLACSLNFEIGEAFAETANSLLKQHHLSPCSVSAIASHGQTAFHIPPWLSEELTSRSSSHPAENERVASTLQIGEGAVIAERTGLPVICDFRTADIAAGGNGAPLVPFADYHLFTQPGRTVIAQNIGGIANCTVLPASGRIEDIIAFDTGPGNMIIDGLMQEFFPESRFDRHGDFARKGDIIPELLDRWMALEYILSPPPKTTGRELFGRPFARDTIREHPNRPPEDLIATATAFTAKSIIESFRRFVFPDWPVSEIILAGGGAENSFLVECISREIETTVCQHGTRFRFGDELGFPSQARECIAFAMLGYARLRKIPANVPSATGAQRAVLLGKIVEI